MEEQRKLREVQENWVEQKEKLFQERMDRLKIKEEEMDQMYKRKQRV